MEALLRKSCTNCTESSIKTYVQNVKALARLAGFKEAPTNAKWLTGKLLAQIKERPLNQYKRLAIAGVKALGAYGKKDSKWHEAMTEATVKYGRRRDTQKRTERETKNWPTDGYKALRKLANTLHAEVEHIEKQAPARVSSSDMYEYQRYFVVLFYAYHALRGDLGDVRIQQKGQNYIYKSGKTWSVHIGQHKTVKSRGAIDFRLARPVSDALGLFLPMVRANTDHGFLLSTKRGRNKLSRKDMLILLRTTTEDRIGKRLGVQMIRVLKTTEHLKSIEDASELQRELGHGPEMQRRYVSKA
jgi:hypothetical protein